MFSSAPASKRDRTPAQSITEQEENGVEEKKERQREREKEREKRRRKGNTNYCLSLSPPPPRRRRRRRRRRFLLLFVFFYSNRFNQWQLCFRSRRCAAVCAREIEKEKGDALFVARVMKRGADRFPAIETNQPERERERERELSIWPCPFRVPGPPFQTTPTTQVALRNRSKSVPAADAVVVAVVAVVVVVVTRRRRPAVTFHLATRWTFLTAMEPHRERRDQSITARRTPMPIHQRFPLRQSLPVSG